MLSRVSLKLLLPVLVLCSLSLVSIFSLNSSLFFSQLIWLILGLAVFFIFSRLDLRGLILSRGLLFFIYLFSLLLLVIALFLPPVRGIHGWIPLGPFNFQPAEFTKLSLLLIFSYFFAKKHVGLANLRNIISPFIIFLIPAFLILAQPDLGSVIILFGLWLSFLLLSGLPWRYLLIGCFTLVFSFLLLWRFGLADYQRDRIVSVFYPEQDPLGINYNVIQSKIAIGSAGFFGKGFRQGTQIQLGFLPEAQTDFIFSSLIEEWGFLAALIVIISFVWLCFSIIAIGRNFIQSNTARFFCLGSVILFGLHFLINTGSATGLSPVIGLPFPFLSYGGSNLLINFIIIAIINSLASRA